MSQIDKTDICFRDPHYLQLHNGRIPSAGHALEYLSHASEFYVSSCINEQIKMQTMYSGNRWDGSKMNGVEYCPWFTDVANQNFHLIKQFRNQGQVYPLAAYYILDGNIYQAPDLHKLVSSRLRSALYHLNEAFSVINSSYKFHPTSMYTCGMNEVELLSNEQADFQNRVDNLIQSCAKKQIVLQKQETVVKRRRADDSESVKSKRKKRKIK